MHCGQFRQFYSDFTDGLLDEAEEVAFHVHMAECVACRKFDAALEQGRSALRRMDPPSANYDFESRLYDRILREGPPEHEPVLRQFSGMAGAALIAAVVGVVGLNVRTAMRPPAPFRQVDAGSAARLFAPNPLGDTVRHVGRVPTHADSVASLGKSGRGVEITTDYMVP